MKVLLVVCWLSPFLYGINGLSKISLEPSNAIEGWGAPLENGGTGPASWLLNEQEAAGDPASGKGGTVTKPWMQGYQSWYYPNLFAIIDLGRVYQLEAIWAFHKWGGADVTFQVGLTPFDFSKTITPAGGWLNKWEGWNVTEKARFIQVNMKAVTEITEMVIYGTASEPPPPPQPRTVTPTKMRNFIGICGFVDDPVARSNAVLNIREYHEWPWTENGNDPGYPKALNKFDPAYGGPPFHFDGYYANTTKAGLPAHMVLSERPPFLTGGKSNEQDWKAVTDANMNNWAATTDPASYKAIAAHAFQFAARYGVTKVPNSELQLATDQKQESGLGTCHGVEFWNEPDKTWQGRNSYYAPYENAAMLSAGYDGHGNTLGEGIGIKNADPHFPVIMSGLAGGSGVGTDYYEAMRLWFEFKRKDKKFPAMTLNQHHYCSDPTKKTGISPEECGLRDLMLTYTKYRDTKLPQLQFWLSEFGYDTYPASPKSARAYGSFTNFEVQGMWILRSYFAIVDAGVDRAHLYMLRDVAEKDGIQYSTSGLCTTKSLGWQPKDSWYYVSTFTTLVKDTIYASNVSTLGVRILHFKHDHAVEMGAQTPTAVYALWLPTSSSKTVSNFKLTLKESSATKVTLVQLSNNSTWGEQSALSPSGGSVTVDVSEMPIFVAVGITPTPPSGPPAPIHPGEGEGDEMGMRVVMSKQRSG